MTVLALILLAANVTLMARIRTAYSPGRRQGKQPLEVGQSDASP